MPFCSSHRLALTTCLATVLLPAAPALAQLNLIPDTAPDRTLGTQVIQNGLPGSDVITGGTRPQNGQNLFHSFQEFNVRENRGVFFQNPVGVQNILTRVTGNNPSNILGTLGVLGNANLFFLNPNGIIFGPNAKLQIQGSFFASTANSFKFSDGSEFSATRPQPAPLLAINITPGLQTGSISPGSTITNRGNLETGQDLVLESDRLDIQGQLMAGRDLTLKAQDTLQARDSTIAPLIVNANNNLLVEGDRAVDIVALSHPQSGLSSGSNLILRSANTVNGDARFRAGGSFRIEQLDGSPGNLSSPQDPFIFAVGDVVLGDYIGESLHVWAGGSITLGDVEITGADPNNGLFETVTLSDGSALAIDGDLFPTLDVRAGIDWSQWGGLPGDIDSDSLGANFGTNATSADITIGTITNYTGTVFLTNQYFPNTSLTSPNGIRTGTIDVSNIGNIDADAGTVVVDARSNFSLNDSTIFADTFVDGRFAGDVQLLAKGGIFFNNSGIANNVTNGVASYGGYITIKAGSLSLVNNSFLQSNTLGFGDAGNITLEVRDTVLLDQSRILSNVQVGAAGNAGAIAINAGSLSILNGASLASDTLGTGDAGNITIQVRDTVLLAGRNANGDGSSIISRVGDENNFAEGNSGAISINARSVILQDGASLDTSLFYGSGINGDLAFAGDVEITATDAVSLDQSRIFSNVEAGSFGFGGAITINSGNVSLTNGANLNSFLRAESQTLPGAIGEAGSITINAQGLVSFDGISSSGTATSIESNVGSGAIGNAGTIAINAGAVSLTNGAQLSSSTFGFGDAADITLRVRDAVLLDQGRIFSNVEPGAFGNGGAIAISAGSLSLVNGAFLASDTLGVGNAGSITVQVRDTVSLSGQSTNGDSSNFFSRVGDFNTFAEGNGGNVSITARSVVLRDGASLDTSILNGSGTNGDPAIAGAVQITATDTVFLDQGRIFSNVGAGTFGNGGAISISAGSLSLVNGAFLASDTLGVGDAGDVTVQVRDTVSLSGQSANGNSSGFFSRVGDFNTFAEGNGGNVSITARSVVLRDGAFLDTSILYGSGADGVPAIAGAVQITATDTVSLDQSRIFSNVAAGSFGNGGAITINSSSASFTNGANLYSFLQAQNETLFGAVGAAGNITINAQGLVSFDGVSPEGTITSAESNVGFGAVGNGGVITVNAGALSVTNGAQLSSSTDGFGNAGNITIRTRGGVLVDSSGDNGYISLIDSQVGTGGQGTAGTIDIAANSLALTNGGQILTVTRGLGDAGPINLTIGDRLTLDGTAPDGSPSAIANDVEAGAEGNSSGITIRTGSLFISGGAELTAATSGFGNAGSIFITARDQVSLTGDGSAKPNEIPETVVPNSINSSAGRGSVGNGGSIRIDTNRLSIQQGARILVSNLEEGQAGNITINARSTTLDRGYIQATTSSGNGGDISLNLRDLLLMRRGSLISATAGTELAGGNGGNVTIRSSFIVGALGENSDITANAFTGRGGNINITTNAIFGLRPQAKLTPLSDITASSEFGLSGTIAITTLNVDPNRGLVALPANLTDPARQISQACAPQGSNTARISRFVVTGRGGIPTSPDTVQTGDRPIVDLVSPVSTTSNQTEGALNAITHAAKEGSPSQPETIVEAQTWVRGSDDLIYLVAAGDALSLHQNSIGTVHCH